VEFLQSLVNEPSRLTSIIRAQVREKKYFNRQFKYRPVEVHKCQHKMLNSVKITDRKKSSRTLICTCMHIFLIN